MTDDEILDLCKRLYRAQVASCTCMTKTPDVKYHDDMCPYKLFAQAGKAIEQLRVDKETKD